MFGGSIRTCRRFASCASSPARVDDHIARGNRFPGGRHTRVASAGQDRGSDQDPEHDRRREEAPAEVLDEQYLDARNAAAVAERDINTTEDALARQAQRVLQLQRQLATRGAALYVTAAGTPDILNIDAANAEQLASRAVYGESTATHDNSLVQDVEAASNKLAETRVQLGEQQTAARKRAQQTAAAKKLKSATARQQKLLSSVNADIMGLVRLVALQREAAVDAATRAAKLGLGPASAIIGTDPGTFPAPSTRRGRSRRVRTATDRQALRLRGCRARRVGLFRPHDGRAGRRAVSP